MMIKGKEVHYSALITLILAIVVWVYPAIRFFMYICFHNGKFSGFFLALLTIVLSGFILALLWVLLASALSDWLDLWLNVKRKTIETREEIRSFPVVARFANYSNPYTESFAVKIKLGEGTYHTFEDLEDYAATKEGDMVKVKVKLYIDAEGDAFYVKPLSIVRECESASEPLTTS